MFVSGSWCYTCCLHKQLASWYGSLQVLTLKFLWPVASFKWPAPASYPTCLVAELVVCKCSHTGTEQTMHSCSVVANSIWQEHRIACRDQVKAQTILLPSNLPNYQHLHDCPFLSTFPLLPHDCYLPIHLDFRIPLVWSLSPKHPIISCVWYSLSHPKLFSLCIPLQVLYPIMQSPLHAWYSWGRIFFLDPSHYFPSMQITGSLFTDYITPLRPPLLFIWFLHLSLHVLVWSYKNHTE